MTPTYEECRAALGAAGARIGAAECHGLLSGMLCAPGDFEPRRLLAEVLGGADRDAEAGACGRLLAALGEDVLRRFHSPDCDFVVLLPDDTQPLEVRAQALAAWCAGFLYGFGVGGVERERALSADTREILADLAGMTRIDADCTPGEENESGYAELVEYLRVGVLLVHAESNAAAESVALNAGESRP